MIAAASGKVNLTRLFRAAIPLQRATSGYHFLCRFVNFVAFVVSKRNEIYHEEIEGHEGREEDEFFLLELWACKHVS